MNSCTKQEDEMLLQFYNQAESFKKWKQISDKFLALGIQKSVYDCRERYINKLDPTIKNEKWTNEEIQSLFMFYRLNGSKWQKMQSVLPHRTQGQLKNKFYSFLRSFILKALQLSKQLKSFKVNSISSKTIKRLFEGTEEFGQLQGRMIDYLEAIEYEISSQRIQQLLNKRESEIKQILKILFVNSKKPKTKETSETHKYPIFGNEPFISPHQLQANISDHSQEQSLSKNNSQKIQKLQLCAHKNSSFDSHSKFNPAQKQQKIQQNPSKHQQMFSPWNSGMEMMPKMQEGGQFQGIKGNGWQEWTKLQYPYQFYSMENCTSRYQPEQDETIVLRQENMYFYCMLFNGQQGYYFHF